MFIRLFTDQHQDGNTNINSAESLLLLVAFIWAINYPIAKFGLSGMDAYVFNAIRYIVAVGVLLVLFRAKSTWQQVAREDRWKLLRAGLIASVIYQAAFITGLRLTTAGNSAIILATSPVWTILTTARLHRERIASFVWLGMALSLAGVGLIIVGSGRTVEFGSQGLIGDCICLVAAMLWGLNTTIQKPLLSRYSAAQLTLVMIGVGAVGLSIIAIPFIPSVPFMTIDWSTYAAAIISGASSIAIANVLWSNGVKRIGPRRTAVYNNLVPVMAFIISYFVLHEPVALLQLIGAMMTIVGVAIARR